MSAMLSHPPVQISDFAAHVARLKANDAALFAAEYESIDPGGQFTWESSNMDVNKPKNRYANVIAYDHSRVRLQLDDHAADCDYINANYLDGYCRTNAYIATQARDTDTLISLTFTAKRYSSRPICHFQLYLQLTLITSQIFCVLTVFARIALTNVVVNFTLITLVHYTNLSLFILKSFGSRRIK